MEQKGRVELWLNRDMICNNEYVVGTRIGYRFDALAGLRDGCSWAPEPASAVREAVEQAGAAPAVGWTGDLQLRLDGQILAEVSLEDGQPCRDVRWFKPRASLPLYEEWVETPIRLTDETGAWLVHGRGHDDLGFPNDLVDALRGTFGDGFRGGERRTFWHAQDPRRVVQLCQRGQLAYFRGQVGVMTESPVGFDPDAVMDGEAHFEAIMKGVEMFRERMRPLLRQYPDSHLFLMLGDPAIDGELSLCAFTPLQGSDDLAFSLAPQDIEAILHLDDQLDSLP